MLDLAKEKLQLIWGYPDFRHPQDRIVESVLQGEDVLAVLPTGGGKSLCYQVPALVNDGVCIVVSPLLALMQDQIEDLQNRGLKALAVNSTLSFKEMMIGLEKAQRGEIKFLYIAPERIMQKEFQFRLQQMKVCLFAVDEAHCIAQWGHDFRPAYLNIAKIRDFHPHVPMLALTATATPEVLKEINKNLQLKRPTFIQGDLTRSNLGYAAISSDDKPLKMVELLSKVQGSAIIYASSRKRVKELADWLNAKGIPAGYYHAGLTYSARSHAYADWQQNRIRVMVATNAFGMGINKGDVRLVIHVDVPMTPEAYFQEAGRAGRDGKKSYAILIYNKSDRLDAQRKLIEGYPARAKLVLLYTVLADMLQVAIGAGEFETLELDWHTVQERAGMNYKEAMVVLQFLERAGYLRLNEACTLPSKVQLVMKKDWIFDFQEKHAHFKPMLQALLRMYSGIQDSPCKIIEEDLAAFMKTNVNWVKQKLMELQGLQVLDYFPQLLKPSVTLLQPRMHPQSLYIPKSMLEDRHLSDEKRWGAMWKYVLTQQCRTREMSHYFGTTIQQDCGICDNCVDRLREMSPAEIKSHVLSMLDDVSKRTEELLSSFPPSMKDRVLQTLRLLQDEELILFLEGVWKKN